MIATDTPTRAPASPPDAEFDYRLATEADVPALGDLWAEHAGWGGLTVAQWRAWYGATPYGPCPVAVAVHADGRVVGQLAFTPSRVLADGRERKALRFSAPIVRSDYRRPLGGSDHPVIGMYLHVVRAAMSEGLEVVYGVPHHDWVRFFRWAGAMFPAEASFANASFGCRAVPVDGAVGVAEPDRSSAFDEFGPEFDAFWERTAQSSSGTLVVRRRAWLAYKYSGAGWIRVALRAPGTGDLVAYAVVRRRDGLLADALADASDRYPALLRAAVAELARRRRAGDEAPASVRVADTPDLRGALDALGAEPVDFRFALVCASLSDGPDVAAVQPARWFVTGGD